MRASGLGGGLAIFASLVALGSGSGCNPRARDARPAAAGAGPRLAASGAATPDARPPGASREQGALLLAFAASFATSRPCHRDSPWGADLFLATVDLPSLRVSGLRAVAADPRAAEWFPALSPSGRWLAYHRTVDDGFARRQAIWVVDLRRGGRPQWLVENAGFAQFSPDERRLYFSRRVGPRSDVYRTDLAIDEATGLLRAGAAQRLTSEEYVGGHVSDPYPLPGSEQVVVTFQRSLQGPAAVGLLDPAAEILWPLTAPDSSGHASCSPGGRAVAFGNAASGMAGLLVREEGGSFRRVDLGVPTSPRALARDDGRFLGVETLNWDYPEWAGEHRLVVSAHGGRAQGRRRAYELSRLYLLGLSTRSVESGAVRVVDLSAALEAAAGARGSDLCTASALVIP